MEDSLVTAARKLRDIDVRVLARFIGNEGSATIAINLEIDRRDVVRIIREHGHDNTGYSKNVLGAYRDLCSAVSATRPVPRIPVPDGGDVLGVPRGAKRGTAGPVAAAAAITPTPEPAPAPVDPQPEMRQADTQVTDSDPPVTDPAPAEVQLPTREEPPMPATAPTTPAKPGPNPRTSPAAIPSPRAADPPITPGPADTADLPAVETILARAEASSSEEIRLAAKQARADIARLHTSLLVDTQADGLRQQIAAIEAEIHDRTERRDRLDQEITDHTARRDRLRAELQALLDGADVIVSATSGPRREVRTFDHPVLLRDGTPDPAAVRAWGRENNYEVKPTGSVAGGVIAAYKRAHGVDPA